MPDLLAIVADPIPTDLEVWLDASGYGWVRIGHPQELARTEPAGGFLAAVVSLGKDSETTWAFCREIRQGDGRLIPLLLVLDQSQLGELDDRHDLFDDIILHPVRPVEFAARFDLLLARTRGGTSPERLELGPIMLNLETYQATVAGRPLDLTYMEYELLRFLMASPGKVFSRESLLNQVWGYDYYGGARTVDVHIRRLRAKLGEVNAGLITTVRSVGYKLSLPEHRTAQG